MSIKVKSLAFVYYAVTDIARARSFYEGLLGLRILKENEFGPGQWWIEYDIAGEALAVSNAIAGGPSASLNLEVTSLDDALAAVKAANVELAYDVMEFPPCRIVGIKDPDGNVVGLHQLKSDA